MEFWEIILQSLLVGFGTAALAKIIVEYSGPFNVFDWLRSVLRLKPPFGGLKWDLNLEDQPDLTESFSEYLIHAQAHEVKEGIWEKYLEEGNHRYHFSLRGTLYGILNCVFCIGPYLCALVSFFVVLGIQSPNLDFIFHWFYVTVGSLGVHFKVLEYRAGTHG